MLRYPVTGCKRLMQKLKANSLVELIEMAKRNALV